MGRFFERMCRSCGATKKKESNHNEANAKESNCHQYDTSDDKAIALGLLAHAKLHHRARVLARGNTQKGGLRTTATVTPTALHTSTGLDVFGVSTIYTLYLLLLL
jgi:hypothetical protein